MNENLSARAGDGKTLAVPFGMALVPREPTPEMVQAGFGQIDYGTTVHADIERAWSCMLDAAPTVAPLTLETAEEAKKDRAHAEAYYRQAEQLLTANEQTLRAEVQSLHAALKLMLRGTQEDCGVISMPNNEAVRTAFAALAAAPAAAPLTDEQVFKALEDEARRLNGGTLDGLQMNEEMLSEVIKIFRIAERAHGIV